MVTQSGGAARSNVMVVFKLTGVQSVTDLTPVNEWNVLDVLSAYNYKGYTNQYGEIEFTITYSAPH
jgi:hypothetical protein